MISSRMVLTLWTAACFNSQILSKFTRSNIIKFIITARQSCQVWQHNLSNYLRVTLDISEDIFCFIYNRQTSKVVDNINNYTDFLCPAYLMIKSPEVQNNSLKKYIMYVKVICFITKWTLLFDYLLMNSVKSRFS